MLSSVRNFAITFCVSILIFGLLAYFIANFAVKAISGADDPEQTTDSADENPDETTQGTDVTTSPGTDDPQPEGTSFNFLIVGVDYQPDKLNYTYDENNLNEDGFPYPKRIASADTIIFLRVDKEKREYVMCALPGTMRISDHGLYKTLGSLYGEFGLDYLVEKAAFLVGLPVDYSAVFTIGGLASLIDELGGIEYYVPVDMSYTDTKEGLTIDLKKGSQKLSGEKTLQMLRFNEYTEGSGTRIDTAMTFLSTMLTKFTDPSYLARVPELWDNLSQYFETDMTEEILEKNLELIFSFPDFSKRTVAYPGSSVTYEGEKYFDPNITKAWSIFQEYKYTGTD